MKTVPHFLRGAFRNAMRVAMGKPRMHKRVDMNVVGNSSCFFSRMLLHRPSRGGNIPKNKLVSGFDDFSTGRWDVLIRASEVCDREAAGVG